MGAIIAVYCTQMAKDMLKALTEFYKDPSMGQKNSSIYSCDFACNHFCSCWKAAEKLISREEGDWVRRRSKERLDQTEKAALAKHGQFTTANSAYVGTEYEKNESRCRLLFLSLDPGGAHANDSASEELRSEFRGLWCSEDDPCRRTPEGMRKGVVDDLKKDLESEAFNFRLGPRGWLHWYCTHLLAAHILRDAAGQPVNRLCEEIIAALDNSKMDRRSKSKKLAEVAPYFAHANVVKCSIGRLGYRQAPDQMYRNCAKYLKGEVRVLKPDIIVTQGDWAGRSVFGACNDRLRELEIDSERALYIRTYHPSNYGRFWKDGKTGDGRRWGVYIDAAADFMRQRRSC
jgi:hypothetical protein